MFVGLYSKHLKTNSSSRKKISNNNQDLQLENSQENNIISNNHINEKNPTNQLQISRLDHDVRLHSNISINSKIENSSYEVESRDIRRMSKMNNSKILNIEGHIPQISIPIIRPINRYNIFRTNSMKSNGAISHKYSKLTPDYSLKKKKSNEVLPELTRKQKNNSINYINQGSLKIIPKMRAISQSPSFPKSNSPLKTKYYGGNIFSQNSIVSLQDSNSNVDIFPISDKLQDKLEYSNIQNVQKDKKKLKNLLKNIVNDNNVYTDPDKYKVFTSTGKKNISESVQSLNKNAENLKYKNNLIQHHNTEETEKFFLKQRFLAENNNTHIQYTMNSKREQNKSKVFMFGNASFERENKFIYQDKSNIINNSYVSDTTVQNIINSEIDKSISRNKKILKPNNILTIKKNIK